MSSIFLAGPSPRGEGAVSYRAEALRILVELGFDGLVLSPEPEFGFSHSYVEQVEWERTGRLASDLVVFWVPRAMNGMPGLTTNVEFGEDWPTRKVLYGRPDTSERNRYLDSRWRQIFNEEPYSDLRALLERAVRWLGMGAERHGADALVPLSVWRMPAFQTWRRNLIASGNALRSFELMRAVPAAANGGCPMETPWAAFIARAGVWDAREQRLKDNEVMVTRGDATAVAAFWVPSLETTRGEARDGARVVLAQEFRQAVNNPEGLVMELPGGSATDPDMDQRMVACDEFFEEAGLRIDPQRFIFVESRQMAATLLTHHTHLFMLRLNDDEARQIEHAVEHRTLMGTAGSHIDEAHRHAGERITLAFPSMKDVSGLPVDWSTRGMIQQAWETWESKRSRT